MIMRKLVVAVMVLAFMPALAFGAVIFSDDMSTGTNWGTVANSADDIATFGFDYGTMGIPAAPGGADTIGLKLAANTADGAAGAVTVYSTQTFSGVYMLEFDSWCNFDTVSGGTSEMYGGGTGHDQATINRPGWYGAGSFLAMYGDGLSSRDYRMYKDAQEQWVSSGQYNSVNAGYPSGMVTNHDIDPFWQKLTPAVDLTTFDPPQSGQSGTKPAGQPAFAWHHIEMTVLPALGIVFMEFDGQWFGMNGLAGNPVTLDGALSFFHYDAYGSVAGAYGFSIVDNVVVHDTPEPATLALLSLGGLALLRRRR
jgi:hypothetical protein